MGEIAILPLGKTPNPKQIRFFLSRKKYVGYGGARGGGKSWAMRTKLILLALGYNGLQILMLRRTLPELRENHLLPMLRMLYGVARYNKDERAFSFPNGSRIRLGYCDSEADVYQYQGQEYDVIGVEECTHFTWTQIEFLTTCNRSIRKDFSPRMYFTGNPGGVGHEWFKRLFVKGKYRANENPDDYDFIPATVDDNYVLMEADPQYVATLDALPYAMRQAHRYGNWDIFEGQYFEQFADFPEHYKDRMQTHVIDPFPIPQAWTVYRSFDYGYAKPFSCGWWAIDYDGRMYRIKELYGCLRDENGEDVPNTGVKWPMERIFETIATIERTSELLKGREIYGVADPSIWDASKGPSIADTAAQYGVYFDKGDNKRIPGWQQLQNRMTFDEYGIPMIYVFSTCKSFIRTMPLLQYDKHNSEDLDTDGEDHIADETRYMCMARPIEPIRKPPREARQYNPLEDDDTDLFRAL